MDRPIVQQKPLINGAVASGPDRAVSDGATLQPGQWEQLVRLAGRFVRTRQDAEDAVQQALLGALAHRDQLRDPSRQWAWTRRIVIRQALLVRRRQQRNQRMRLVNDDLEQRQAKPVVPSPPEEAIGALQAEITRLPSRQQIAIVLRHLEQWDYREIAKVMQVSESTVRGFVRAARNTLRKSMTQRLPQWSRTFAEGLDR